jgi:hypothetical protein
MHPPPDTFTLGTKLPEPLPSMDKTYPKHNRHKVVEKEHKAYCSKLEWSHRNWSDAKYKTKFIVYWMDSNVSNSSKCDSLKS